MRLWDLPGARRFVDTVAGLLRDGNSVVVRFPGELPQGFDETVAANVGNVLKFSRLPATGDPWDAVTRRYTTQPDHVRRHADLCADEGFRGRLVRPLDLDRSSWLAWRDFLVAHSAASRHSALVDRSVFLVPLTDCPAGDPPATEVGIADLEWDAVLNEFDLLLLASERLRERRCPPLMRSLLTHTVAGVAAWDFHTVDILASEPDTTILSPHECLRAIARDLGWTADTPRTWHLGTASQAGVAHPARAALDHPTNELDLRLWSAQLAVLLPWIETRRHRVIEDNLSEVRRRMRANGDANGDPYALEVGDLHALIARSSVSRRVRKTVELLRNARNQLAHREHMPYDRIRRLLS